MNDGYVNLFRKMTEWQWYKNQNTKDLFIHCLLKANWKDGKFENIIVPRGSFITSIANLSKELNLSQQQIRTAIGHLENTNEIVQKSTNKYTLITIVKYGEYQNQNEISTNNQQTNNKQITTIETFNKNNKENNNIIYNNKEIYKEDYNDIISYLNLKTNSSYKPTTPKTRELIKARYNEGFNLDDFKQVIDNKVNAWGKDKKMSIYLRPETLFSNKFEGYLNEKTKQTTKDLKIDISDF